MCKVPCTVILIFFFGLHSAGGYTTVERVSGQCPTILSSGECQSLAPYHGLPWNGIGLIGPRGCFRSDIWGFTGLYYRGGSNDCTTTRKCICKVLPTATPTVSPPEDGQTANPVSMIHVSLFNFFLSPPPLSQAAPTASPTATPTVSSQKMAKPQTQSQ